MAKFSNIVIDLNNLFWRNVCTSVKRHLDNDCDNYYSSSIESSITRIRELHEQFGYKDTKVYILHDNPFSKIDARKEIMPSYKHARKNKNIPPVFYKSLEHLIQILKSYSDYYYIVGLDNCEADDLVPSVLNVVEGNTILVSADLDWARGIVENNVVWYNYNTVYTNEVFKNEYGFDPFGCSIKMYKAIHGDDSDCIPNAVPGLRKEILIDIANKYSSVDELFLNLKDEDYKDIWKAKLIEGKNQIKINYQLVDYLNIGIPLSDIIYKCKESILDLRFLYDMCQVNYEGKMIDSSDTNKSFLKKGSYKRNTKF